MELIISPSKPEIEKQSETVQIVHGYIGFGQYLGVLSMNKAIDIAKEFGVGIVGVRNSNHFGACGYYTQLAAEKQQIGFSVSNSATHVSVYVGIKPVLGSNPFVQ